MEHINTLDAYENLIAAGVMPEQARAQVKLLNNSMNHLATKQDLQNAISNMEKDLKIFFVFLVTGSILVTYLMPLLIPIILRKFGI